MTKPTLSPLPEPAEAVHMAGISKRFGGVQALKKVDFQVRWGEIHALVGGNGAGKSTLLKILRGVQAPDEGTVQIGGRLLSPLSPEAARRAGVAMIFQEMSLIPTLSVAQNLFLNREYHGPLGLIDDKRARKQAGSLLAGFGLDLDPSQLVSSLGTGQRQILEILKALAQEARVLILDEPTSALSSSEVDRLFAILKRLKSGGAAVIYVSHRMEEILRLADQVTVLRDGEEVLTSSLSGLTLEDLVGHVVGRSGGGFSGLARPEGSKGEPMLELKGVSGARKLKDLQLTVRSGEVVGVAGLLGSGRSTLARLLYGMEKAARGEIRIRGLQTKLKGPQEALSAGLALIPEDRLRQGLVSQHSVADNICLPVLGRLSRFSWILKGRARGLVKEQVERLRIKAESPDTAVNTLSGGNQQKVVLAKGLAADPAILVLDEPTAGVDIGSKAEIVEAIRGMARQGKAVLLISSEMAELLAASDRIVVMAQGRIAREVPRKELEPPGGAARNAAERLQYAQHRLQVAVQSAHAKG